MSLQLMLLLLPWLLPIAQAQSSQDYILACSSIPNYANFNDNLSYLWGKASLHDIDRYAFLIICPFLIVLQLITIKFYYDNPRIMGKAGLLFCVVIVFQMITMMHFIASGTYFTINQSQVQMPSSFPAFCEANSIISALSSTIHLMFVILVPLYIIYILRTTLKAKAKIWNFIYALVLVLCSVSTFFLWEEDFLGLNIYGVCGVTFIRTPNASVALPVVIVLFNVLFLGAGIFTINYFTKHMPNSIGLRQKRQSQKQTLLLYVIGYSTFWILESIIEITLFYNCQSNSPNGQFYPLVTIYNLLRILQCFLIFFIIFKDSKSRKALKKSFRRFFHKKTTQNEFKKSPSYSFQSDRSSDNPGEFNFQEVLLRIKEDSNQIDILKISQIVTMVSGIYIAYKQYYNTNDEYFNVCMLAIDRKDYGNSDHSMQHRKDVFFKKTKKIFFHQKMSIKLNNQVTNDFIVDMSLLPKLGILECTMIIHAPKIFQLLLESDNLQSISDSFQLHNNTRKMFDLAEGQGGRSGEFFFFSSDNKYVLKTITQQEFQFIDQNLFYFYEHYRSNPESVLAKIYGLFTFRGDQIQRTFHLILMKNILGCSNSQIIRTYDMKGSRYDREVNKGDTYTNQLLKKMTLKDIDFMKEQGRIHIKDNQKLKLREIIMRDTIFLKNLNLIDYSLLVVRVRWNYKPQNANFWGEYQRLSSDVSQDEFYHIGIIDYLQKWDLQKRGEKWWKKFLGKKNFSAQNPKKYQHRYMNFVSQITQLIRGLLPSWKNQNEEMIYEESSEQRQARIESQQRQKQQMIKQMQKGEQEHQKQQSLTSKPGKKTIEVQLSYHSQFNPHKEKQQRNEGEVLRVEVQQNLQYFRTNSTKI